MPRIEVNTPAPHFSLEDYRGKQVSLKDFRGRYVLLVFNRGFL